MRGKAYRIEIMDCGFLTCKIVNENKNRTISNFVVVVALFYRAKEIFCSISGNQMHGVKETNLK